MVRGNQSLFAVSRSNDQDGRHANILQKPFKIVLLRNHWCEFHETLYVALGTEVLFNVKVEFVLRLICRNK